MNLEELAATPSTPMLFQFPIFEGIFIELFYLGSCPGRFTEEFEAGLYRRVADETIDPDLVTQFIPAEGIDEVNEDFFERKAMKRIF